MSRVSEYFKNAPEPVKTCNCNEYCSNEAVIVLALRTPMDIPAISAFIPSERWGTYYCENHREEGEFLQKNNPMRFEIRGVNNNQVPLKPTGPEIKCSCGAKFRTTTPKDYEKSGYKSFAQNMNRFHNQPRQEDCPECGKGHIWSLSSMN